MASAFVRPGNRWFARYTDASGRRRVKRLRQQTRRDALKVAHALEAKAERQRLGLEAPESAGVLCGPLMKRWAVALDNRAADIDRGRIDLHVLPRWKSVRLVDVTVAAILTWLADMRDAGKIGPGSQRHALGLLSRFLSWCVENDHAKHNPCRDVPPGRRPRPIPPRPESVPWVKTDAEALAILRALPAPFAAVFFVGNRSGARLSEILSLRLSDLDDVDQGVVRIRYAGADGTGWVKEAKYEPRTKYAPIPAADARAILGPILEARRAAGAGPEAFLFVDQDGDRIDRHAVTFRWRTMREALQLPKGLNFYRATRHSAASRAQSLGASAAEIAGALGHASPAITLKHYMHAERRPFSSALTAGLGLDGAPGAKVIHLVGRTHVTETAAAPAAAAEGDHHAA